MGEYAAEVITFVLSVLGGYMAAHVKLRSELAAEYDKSLREKRLAAYAELWKLTQDLAKYARPRPVTYEVLAEMHWRLRRWYFETGGLYLSVPSRDAYFALQDVLARIVEDPARRADRAHEYDRDAEEYERLRKPGSALRTCLSADVGTRRSPLFEDSPLA